MLCGYFGDDTLVADLVVVNALERSSRVSLTHADANIEAY